MRRRDFIKGIVGSTIAWPLVAGAQQQSGKIYRIGLLTRKTDASVANQINAFRHGLRDLGWVEGTSIGIEYRDAEGQLDRLHALAAELVALNVDVIVTVDTPPTQAAKQATSTIPIVVAVYALAAAKQPPDALFVLSPIYAAYRNEIAEFVAKMKLPILFDTSGLAGEPGALLSYGADISDLFRRAATFVDKILKGAKPADLPVEQPIKFELVINLKTAKALGIDVPLHLQQIADEVIE
jgi:ABC-type uncharacterized transport system substrate-binding protein